MSYNQKQNSIVKHLTSAIPLVQTLSVLPKIKSEKPLWFLSLPASCGVFEQELKDRGVIPFMVERDKRIFKKNKTRFNKIGIYKNQTMNFVGDFVLQPDFCWADYCGYPSFDNMKIAERVKLAFATFNINSRFVKNGKSVAIKNNSFLKDLKGCDEAQIIKAIKKFYEINYPDYRLITLIRYVSSHEPMLVIGLAHKSLRFPEKMKEIQTDLNEYYSEKRNGGEKMLDSFIKRTHNKASNIKLDLDKYMNKRNPKNKMKNKGDALKKAVRILYLDGGMSDEEIMEVLGINKMKLAGTKATCKRYRIKA